MKHKMRINEHSSGYEKGREGWVVGNSFEYNGDLWFPVVFEARMMETQSEILPICVPVCFCDLI